MSEIKWPTDVGERMLDAIHAASINASVSSAWAKLTQYVIDNTTWHTRELHCQATVNFTARVRVPPGTDFEDDIILSEHVQQFDNYVTVEASCSDDELDDGCVLQDIEDEEITDFILVEAT